MSIPDALIEKYLTLVSGLSREEVERTLALGPRDAKAALARQLVRRLDGEEAALRADQDFDRKFRSRDLDQAEIPEVVVPEGATAAQALVTAGFEPSISKARRLGDQGALSIDG